MSGKLHHVISLESASVGYEDYKFENEKQFQGFGVRKK